ncbi:MAG: ABC transporter substrate-binding protein [Alphaproteobacteria bacterium]
MLSTAKGWLFLLAALAVTAGGAAPAAAESEVVIGAVYPLSGPAAPVGVDARAALDTAVDIVNNSYDLDLPLAKGAGLTNLGGAKIRVVWADHQADPQKGRAEAERLITEEKVAALVGAYHSAVSAVIGQVSERYQIPFVTLESSSPTLTRQGFKWFFRTGPHDEMFSAAMFELLKALKAKKGIAVSSVALFHEDTLFGTDSAKIQRGLAEQAGIKVVADIKYRSNSPSLTSEVEQLKASGAEVVMPTSYTNDAILLIKTMGELGYHPTAIIAQDAGFSESAFFAAVGDKVSGLISRASFALDLMEKRPSVRAVNEMYRKRSGKDLNENTAREITGFLAVADAINRAGSTKPEAVLKALRETNIPPAQLIMPWQGIKFDETGQNTLATPVMVQYLDGQYRTVWPFESATREVVWPMPWK